ncbi:MAG TPA: hypothetical protein VL382_04300 [Terriglobales bacterium]|nr:hypothetical protein [Terriglobales bacterium]
MTVAAPAAPELRAALLPAIVFCHGDVTATAPSDEIGQVRIAIAPQRELTRMTS